MFVLDNGKRFVIPRTEMTYPGHSLKLHQNAADPVKSPVDHVMADFEDACPYEFKGPKSQKTMVEALTTLSEKSSNSESGEIVTGLLNAIRRGESFSQAVARFPRHFSPLYVATIRASERTGNVKEALGRYIAYQQELDKVTKKMVSAAIYPAILAIVGALVLGFLMFYVVPRFARVYEDMSSTLPFFSQVLLGFGSWQELSKPRDFASNMARALFG